MKHPRSPRLQTLTTSCHSSGPLPQGATTISKQFAEKHPNQLANELEDRLYPSSSLSQTKEFEFNDLDSTQDYSQNPLPSSSVLNYLQRRRPNRQPIDVNSHAADQPSIGTSKQNLSSTPLYYSIRRPGARYGKGMESIKTQSRQLAFKIKSTLLLRMLGSALGTLFKFAVLVLLLIPLVVYIFPIGENYLGLLYAQAAVSCVGQFILLALSQLSLIHHVYSFTPNFYFLRNELKKPVVLFTVLIVARVFSSFTACILSAAGFSVTVRDVSASAVVGIIAILDDISRRRFHFNWTHHIQALRSMKRAKSTATKTQQLTRLLIITISGLIGSMCIQKVAHMWYVPRQKSVTRLVLALLFSPFPFPGIITEARDSSTFQSTIKLFLIGLTTYWVALWINKLRLDYSKAVVSKMLEMDSELLLSLSGRSFTGQIAFWSHLVSLVEDFPTRPITSCRTAFIESEVANRLDLTRPSNIAVGQQHRDYIYLPKKSLEDIRREQAASLSPRLSKKFGGNKGESWTSIHMIPYKFGASLVQHLFRCTQQGSNPAWLQATALCLCQQVVNWPARVTLFALQPDVFLGLPPPSLDKAQLETLTGMKRAGFFSAFGSEPHRTILTGEATKLLFGGHQACLAILKRQVTLIKALQYILFVTETVTITPPTGSFIRAVPKSLNPQFKTSVNQDTSAAGKRHESIFRFNPGIESAAETGIGLLLGSDLTLMSHEMIRWSAFVPMSLETTEQPSSKRSKWLKFDDGTVGLLASRRKELLELCRATLIFNLDLALVSLEATLCLLKAYEAFFPRNSSTRGSALVVREENRTQMDVNSLKWETREKLKQHFPSLNQMNSSDGQYVAEMDRGGENPCLQGTEGDMSTLESSSVYALCKELLSLVSHSCLATAQFSAIPNCAPYATRHPVLASAAEVTSAYMKRWTQTVFELLGCHDEIIPMNVISPAKRKRI